MILRLRRKYLVESVKCKTKKVSAAPDNEMCPLPQLMRGARECKVYNEKAVRLRRMSLFCMCLYTTLHPTLFTLHLSLYNP
jgi:hypothetical protein